MKRELKPASLDALAFPSAFIAEPIPMKRELKLPISPPPRPPRCNCRAYPDEKGIETLFGLIPYQGVAAIAEPIPMKRELKRSVVLSCFNGFSELQSLSR